MADELYKQKKAQIKDQQLGSTAAQRLLEKLSRISTYVEPYQRRWFWELVQNASDVGDECTTIDIILEVTKDKITFKHNGKPFSLNDAINLIYPDSGKICSSENDEESKETRKIGKFGSGFISTHILSSQIIVNGIIHDKDQEPRSFTLDLKRKEVNKPFLIDELTREDDAFGESITLRPDFYSGDISASFTYDLTTPLPNIPRFIPTDDYLKYLFDVIPYTMCFMPKLGSVTIEDKRNNIHRFSCVVSNRTNEDVSLLIKTDNDEVEKKFKYFTTDKAQTVFEYDENRICPYSDSLPRLFCGLPMVGTEIIGLPIVINSENFEPSDERDSVELIPGTIFDDNIVIMRQAVDLYKKVLDFVEYHHMSGAYYLTHISTSYKCNNPISKQQFSNVFIIPSSAYVRQKSIVKSNEGKYIAVCGAKIPFGEEIRADDKLYDLVSYVKSAYIPCKEDYKNWVEALDFSIFKETTYRLYDLLREIENLGKVSLVGESQLHEILSYASKSNDYRYVFTQLELLPSQDGKLRKSTIVYIDDAIPSQLKKIYNSLYTDSIETILLNTLYNDLNVVQSKKTEQDVALSIDSALKDKYKTQGNVNSLLSPINELFDWIKEQNEECGRTKEQLRTLFPWFYEKKESLLVEALPDKNRENVLRIAQSENLDKLSLLADCDPSLLTNVMNQVDAMVSAAQQGLSKKEQEEWNERARELSLISLKERGYTTPSLSDTHGSIINNVIDKDGVSHTVLVKSAAKGTIYMEPTEWAILFRDPLSIFMVYDGKMIHAQKASILFKSQDLLQLTFSTENLLFDDRVKRIISIFSGFENTHLNLRSLNMINRGEEYGEYNFWDNNPENNSLETASID